jgi:pimeloyl-ACP methyl ester carboxylesterase
VLIVDGAESRQARRTDKQVRYDAIPNCQRTTIARAGHMIHQDHPEQLADAVSAFLQR